MSIKAEDSINEGKYLFLHLKKIKKTYFYLKWFRLNIRYFANTIKTGTDRNATFKADIITLLTRNLNFGALLL